MNWLRGMRGRFRVLFQKKRVEQDMAAELHSHIEMQTLENLRAGMKPEEARCAARLEFGSLESIKQNCRDERGVPWIEHLGQDIRFGVRMLARRKGSSALTVLTLALGVGAITAIVSIFYGMLLKPLPHERPGRLVTIRETANWQTVSAGAFNDWKRESTCFEGFALLQARRMNLTGNGEPLFALCWAVSANLLDVLRINPRIGRGFLPGEDQPGADGKIALLTDSFWKRNFDGDTNVLGRIIRLNQQSYRIIGVLPVDVAGVLGGPPDFLIPLVVEPGMRENYSRGLAAVWARLRPGVTLHQAETELATIKQQHQALYPKDRADLRPAVLTIGSWLFGYIKAIALMLFGGAICVLLIACTNVASLLLAQGIGRQREMSLRVALGAGRGRIARQLLTEGALIGLFGGGLALLVAFWGSRLLPPLLSEGGDPQFLTWATRLDIRIVLFSLLFSVATGILSALIPAIFASAPDLNQVLKKGAHSLKGAPHTRIRNGLLVSEIALSLTLLIVVGLFLKSLAALFTVPLGYRPENAVSMNISLPTTRYPDARARGLFFQQVFERVEAQPGIEACGAASTMPMGFSYNVKVFVEGVREQRDAGYDCHYDLIRGRYLRALGIALRKGRDLSKGDYVAKAAPVCLVNEALAHRLFGEAEALGRRLRLSNTVYEVVGVVGNTRHDSLLDATHPDGRVYLSQAEGLNGDTPWLFVRSTGPPAALARLVRQQMQRIDPDQPIGEFGTLKEDILNRTATQRLMLKLLSAFGVLAVALAGVGLYGLIASEVARKTGEFGIRMALGARRVDVLKLVLKKGISLTCRGIVLGVAVALAAQRLIASQLYEAKASDPIILTAAISGFLAVALVACWLPALRATKADPITALRCE